MANKVDTTLVIKAADGGIDDYLKKIETQVDRISKKISNMGGQYSQALANVLDPSRSPASTKAAGTVFNQATEGMTRLMEAQTTQMKTKGEEAKRAVENTAERHRLTSARNMKMYGTENVEAITKIQQAKAAAALDTYTKRTSAMGARADASTAQTLAGYDARELRNLKVQDTLNQWNASDMEEVGEKKKRIAQGFVNISSQRLGIRQAGALVNIQNEQTAQMGANRRTAERGGTILDVIQANRNLVADRLIDRGGTRMEARQQAEEYSKAVHERRKEAKKMREEERAARMEERQQGRTDRQYSQLGSQMMGMMPGAGMLQGLGRYASMLSPGAASFMQGLPSRMGALGGRVINGTAMRGVAANLPAGVAGGVPLGAAGGFLQPGGMSLAPGVGLGTVLGGVAGGLGMAAVGTVYLGEKGIAKAQQAVGSRISGLIGQEMTARSAAAAGGAQNLNAALIETGDLSRYGLDNAKSLQMYSSFLNARGSSARMAPGETKGFLETAAKYNMDPAIGGIASALGYSAAGNESIAKSLQGGAGLGGAALSGAAQSMLAQEQRAAGYGMMGTGVAVKNAQFAAQLSQSGYGGGQFGGASVVQKTQGMGGGMADSIRGSLKQMADVQVFAEAVKRSGSLLGGIEMTDQMSAREKMQIAQANDAGRMGLFGQGLSQEQAAGTIRRSVTQAQEPGFSGRLSERAAQTENAMNTQAYNGEVIDSLQRLNATLEGMNMTIVNDVAFIAAYMRKKDTFVGSVTSSLPAPLAWAVSSVIP